MVWLMVTAGLGGSSQVLRYHRDSLDGTGTIRKMGRRKPLLMSFLR